MRRRGAYVNIHRGPAMINFPANMARLLLAAALMAVAGTAASQQAYPSRPIHLVSPFSPGGGNDIMARLIARKLSESLGQQVLVENRPGGNSIIGSDAVAKSVPDGYTLLLGGSNLVLVSLLIQTPFDPIKDFAPVAAVASGELILVLNLSVPANNLRELIALAKSKPGQLNYATYGSGSVSHLGTELFSSMAGIKMQHIPYKSGPPAITDLIGGQVQMYLSVLPSVVPHIKGGRLKAVAISGEHRSSAVPQVPTFTEAGVPGFDAKYWQAIIAPAGTPKPIIDKLSTEIARILALPDTQEYLAKQGMEPYVLNPEQTAAQTKAVMAKYAKIIKDANIKMEN